MKLRYNVTGAPRKALVGAISHELDSPIEYLGAPTFAYKVGGYHIDKTGMVTGEDNLDLEDALRRLGFDTEEREYDEPDTYESGLGELSAWEYPEGPGMVPAQEDRTPVELAIDVPLDGFTPESLSNLTKMVAAKEALLKAALERGSAHSGDRGHHPVPVVHARRPKRCRLLYSVCRGALQDGKAEKARDRQGPRAYR